LQKKNSGKVAELVHSTKESQHQAEGTNFQKSEIGGVVGTGKRGAWGKKGSASIGRDKKSYRPERGAQFTSGHTKFWYEWGQKKRNGYPSGSQRTGKKQRPEYT